MHICELCGQGDFASEDDLRSHVSSVHNSDFGSGASCPFCDLTGITSKEMSIHVQVKWFRQSFSFSPEIFAKYFLQAVHVDSIPSSPISKKPRRNNGVDVVKTLPPSRQNKSLPQSMQTPPAMASSPPQPLSSCPLCPACFSESDKLERHVNVEHRDILSPNRPSRQQQGKWINCGKIGYLNCKLCNFQWHQEQYSSVPS